jgi:ribosomal protein L16 Arg81 hydroxylase
MNLSDLIYPFDTNIFMNEYWQKKPLLIRRQTPKFYENLLKIEDVNAFLKRNDLRFPQVLLVKNGESTPYEDFTVSYPQGSNKYIDGLLNNNNIVDLFNSGHTIILNQFQRSLSPLLDLCKSMFSQFGFFFQTNLYLTPKDSVGFTPHYDTHDVFVIQASGKKYWRIFDNPFPYPLSEQNFTKAGWDNLGDVLIEVELEQGDLIYIPRGYIHEVKTIDSHSLHATLGSFPPLYNDLLNYIVSKSTDLVDLRKSFSPKDNMENILNHVKDILGAIVSREDILVQIQEFIDKSTQLNYSLTENRLLDTINNKVLTLELSSSIKLTRKFYITEDEENLIVNLPNKQMFFPHFVRETLNKILEKESIIVSDLVGKIDEKGIMVLVTTLIKEGVLQNI